MGSMSRYSALNRFIEEFKEQLLEYAKSELIGKKNRKNGRCLGRIPCGNIY